jgi:hypothetical protein
MNMNEGARRARLSWRLYAAISVAAALGGCLTESGPPLSSLATVSGPPKGMARIVVVRQTQTTSTFAYLDRPGGSHQLSAEIWGNPGVTRRDFTAVAGRTYYFRASPNEKMNDVAVVSMLSPVGGLITAAATYDDHQGPIDLAPIEEVEAKQLIAAAQAEGQ